MRKITFTNTKHSNFSFNFTCVIVLRNPFNFMLYNGKTFFDIKYLKFKEF